VTDELSGVVAAAPTPFAADGRPDTERLLAHCEWVLAHGCDGINLLGTTGEANSLPTRDRAAVMRAAAGRLDRRRLMVGTGTPGLATTIELTRLAADLGYAAALVLPPYYYKPVEDDALFAWFARLVEAVDSALLGIYLYNFPQLTGIRLAPELAARLAAAYPGRVRGAKDSSGNFDYARALTTVPGFKVFPSDETALAVAGRDGFAGCISGTVNVTAPAAVRLWAAPADADALDAVRRQRRTITAQPLIPAVKHLIARREDDPAWEHVAPPLMPLTDAQRAALHAGTDALSRRPTCLTSTAT